MKARVALIGCVSLLLALGLWFESGRDERMRARQKALEVDGAREAARKGELAVPSSTPVISQTPADPTGLAGPAVKDAAETRSLDVPLSVNAPRMLSSVPTAPPPARGKAEITPEEVALDLDKITLSLRDYRTVMRENPVGTNAEITHALNGGNPRQARLLPEGQPLNGDGEMIDRWGTPYFFHQLSRDHMEIRSAGPDKTMWTPDDSVSN